MISYTIAILLLPLLAFMIQVFLGKRLPRNGDWLPTGAIFLSLLLSISVLYGVVSRYDPAFREHIVWPWLDLGVFRLQAGILLDNITAIMLVVVTVVSSLVHLYSIGYMHGDPRYSRFFAYLALFSFSMIGLVLADSFFFVYCFWELVGLSSYLLIGFWFEKNTAADACKKAFITTRIGDIGMFIGILILFAGIGSLGYEDVFGGVAAGKIGGLLLTVTGLCLFLGAVGKSAQFPLHVWLPDAMEGPTPVSALIHAATMVAAGVYLVVRIYPILTPDALLVIAYIGAITAFLGATIAIAQNDIKRVLAYSTISQLGYMMLGLGVGAYTAGFFHLATHAAFKACLFLCSGSVIHAVHTQDMREMGGLRSKMPVTYWTCLLATLAISGIPLTSGFLSKDAILAGVLEFGAFEHPSHFLLPVIGFLCAGITAFYMFRLIFMTFHGAPRLRKAYDHAHESPWVMTVPLVVLASLTVWFLYSLNPFSTEGWFAHLVPKPASLAAPALEIEHVPGVEGGHGAAHYLAMLLSLVVATVGIYVSYLTYFAGRISAERWASSHPLIYRTLLNKYYFDELYSASVIRFTLALRSFLGWFDLTVIDGLVNLTARLTVAASSWDGKLDNIVVDGAVNGTGYLVTWSGGKLRRLQAGRVQNYLILALTGIVIIFLVRAF